LKFFKASFSHLELKLEQDRARGFNSRSSIGNFQLYLITLLGGKKQLFVTKKSTLLNYNFNNLYITTVAHPIKLFFFAKEEVFATKLGHFTISDFFLYVTKHSN